MVSLEDISQPKAERGLGLRQARLNNAAMLGKLSWELLGESNNKLWTSIIQSKYLSNTNLMWTSSLAASCIWKAIFRSFSELEDGFGFRIGSGSQVSFWHYCWAVKSPLSRLAPSVLPEENHLKVCTYSFKGEVFDCLGSSPTTSNDSGADLVTWL